MNDAVQEPLDINLRLSTDISKYRFDDTHASGKLRARAVNQFY
jgi:hypothetical protein